jgi:anaerobic magnesium-protoporphyrin IX monomethyl ester cyclase
MRITLIALDRELYCIGLRVLSSCLKEGDHHVQMVFMPPEIGYSQGNHKFQALYSETTLTDLANLCSDSGLIGISLMTNQFLQACHVTNYLKRKLPNTPIIWGGIHPTVEPERCLEFADIICIGEGEESLVELAWLMEHKMSYLHVENMWFKSDEGIIRNPLKPLIEDLDVIPFPDYSCENHFIATRGHIAKLTKQGLIAYEGERFRSSGGGIFYPVMTSRGCPFECTYCCNSVFHRLYPGQKHLRWRSTDSVIEELQTVREKVACISRVLIVDDNFTARSVVKLKEFCESYRREIGVPFFAQVSPLTISVEKMRILIDCGCIKVAMGVETGSKRIAHMYGRAKSHAAMPRAISIIEKFRETLPYPPSYQFIIDNPYETIEETVETLRLAVSLPRPWDNPIYSLMLFPGTPLYEKATSNELIKDMRSEVYGKDWHDQTNPFLRFWVQQYRANRSPSFLRLLLTPWLVRLLSSHFANRVWRFRDLE